MVDLEFEDDDYSATAVAFPTSDTASDVEVVIPLACAGMRLDQTLAELFPDHSRNRLAALIRENAVHVDDARAQGKQRVKGGEKVLVALRPRDEDLAFRPEPIDIRIVHEDACVIVLDKPAGLVVHPAAGNWSGTLLNGLLHHWPELARVPRAGIVHRLDKDTSGLMVVAKTEAAQLDLVRQLQARSVKREYVALAQGRLERDSRVDAPIGRNPRARTRMAVVSDGKPAVTRYRVIERLAVHTLIECTLETGRTHQIRVHMQSIGHPLEGDVVYGAKAIALTAAVHGVFERFRRQALHARRLAFEHPATHALVQFEAPVPDDLQSLIDAARSL